MLKKTLVLVLAIFIAPIVALATGGSTNTGFVNGPVWFSDNSPSDTGGVIDVYTAIFNAEKNTVDFSISLKDNNVVVQTKSISVEPKETKTVKFAWNVGKGKHTFFAEINSAKINGEDIDIKKSKTSLVSISVGDSVSIPSQDSMKPIAMLENMNLKPGSTEDKVKNWLIQKINNIEKWRTTKESEFKESLVEVKKDRESIEGETAAVRGISFLHMWGLMIAGFILSFAVLFYLFTFTVFVWLLRKIFDILRRILRRREEV